MKKLWGIEYMIVASNPSKEQEIVRQIISSNEDLNIQHKLFVEEMRFKQILIDSRRKKLFTQKQLSEASGLSQQAISRLERGKGGTIETVIRYLYAMGLSLDVGQRDVRDL